MKEVRTACIFLAPLCKGGCRQSRLGDCSLTLTGGIAALGRMVHFPRAGKMFQRDRPPPLRCIRSTPGRACPDRSLRSLAGHTPARHRLRSHGTLRRSMLTRAAVPLALRAKGTLLPCARYAKEFRSCGSVPAGGALAGRAGWFPHKIAKARHNVPGLSDDAANQEVISPLIAVVCAAFVKHAFNHPAHSIASSKQKVKHKSKKAALCAAFLYDFARKAAQYVCRLPMDKAYIAMTMIVNNIAHRSTLVNTKIQKRLHTFIGAAFRKTLRRFTPALPHAPASGCHSAAAMPLWRRGRAGSSLPRHYHSQLTASEWALKCPSGLRRPGLQNTSFVWLPAAVKQNAAFCIIAYGTAPGTSLTFNLFNYV